MTKILENQRPTKIKKKVPKRKRTGFFKIMVIGFFSFSIVALIIGFAGAVFIYNKFSDELPDELPFSPKSK